MVWNEQIFMCLLGRGEEVSQEKGACGLGTGAPTCHELCPEPVRAGYCHGHKEMKLQIIFKDRKQ